MFITARYAYLIIFLDTLIAYRAIRVYVRCQLLHSKGVFNIAMTHGNNLYAVLYLNVDALSFDCLRRSYGQLSKT